ncbi:hypothetical protein F5Y19DRAFT_72473 [Xylariaceae sp. FL1651]|nr:hypothetical protein F5Y19DRAFT_72473 [Xylariaceae sp. FL1651]
MTASTASISDDWQHVEDDNDGFSVVSLPASEDDLLSPRGRPISPASCGPSDSLVDLSHHPPSEKPISTDIRRQDSNGEQETGQDVEKHGMDFTDVVEPGTPKAQLNEILDVDIDPNFLCEVTVSLVQLIAEIMPVISFRGHHQSLVSVTNMRVKCELLRSHLKCLEAILNGYAKHWKPEGETVQLPIDPGLYEWLASLKIELLSIQAALKSPSTQVPIPTEISWDSQIKGYCETLASFTNQIEAFMPVIQTDYDEFHTAHLPVVLTSRDVSGTSSRNEGGPPIGRMPPGSSLFHLRRELYALKDQIASCLEEIDSNRQLGISNSPDECKSLTALTSSYQGIKSSLDMMLSNHASDWIDYSIAGGLTYPEFCRLNPDTIRSLILQLKEVTDDLFLERSRAQTLRYTNDPDGLLQGVIVVVKKPIIDTLRTIEEVLVSILQIRNTVGFSQHSEYTRA